MTENPPHAADGSLVDQTVTHWIQRISAGDSDAAQDLWTRYFQRLVRLARDKFKGRRVALGDEEDVALSAFNSICRGAEQGRFPKLADREDLWRLLVVITARKVAHLLRDAGRGKRGGDRQREVLSSDAVAADLSQLISREPSPEFSAEFAESFQRLLGLLDDATLTQVAVAKLEGYSTREIADRLDCAPRTIERKVQLIRQLWQHELELERG